jgi:SAM-dependent methyltransferase
VSGSLTQRTANYECKAGELAPAARFSSRADHYARARPSYPGELIDLLASRCGLTRASVIADIGSGTGLLAELFLRHGNRVLGVEPNAQMREAGERLLAGYARFMSVPGSAEQTELPAACVDLVVAGQAFHWFDAARARVEFARILRAERWVVLAWNVRRVDTTPFLRGYDALLHACSPEYAAVVQSHADEQRIAAFFAPSAFERSMLGNAQVLDWESLVARHLSQSFVPQSGPVHEAILRDLRTLFDGTQQDGKISFEYNCRMYYGCI